MVVLHYDYCSFVIFLVIMLSMLLRRVVKGSTNGIFFHVVLLSLLATTADILSEWRGIPVPVRFLADTFYFLLTVEIPLLYTFYIYSSVGLLHYVKVRKIIWVILFLPLAILLGILIINFFNHCVFTVNEHGDYVRGPLQPALIICSLLYILFGISIIIRWRSIIPLSKQIALFCLFPIISAALIVQQFYQGLELTMFGLSISELIISFTVQRSDENFDKSTGTKTFDSALDDFDKVYRARQNVFVIFIKITNSMTLKRYLGTRSYQNFLKTLSKDLNTVEHSRRSNCENYGLDETTYVIKVESTGRKQVVKLAEDMAELLQEPFIIDGVSLNLDSRVCIARLPDDLGTLEDFMDFRLSFHKKLPPTKDVLKLWDFSDSQEFHIKNEIEEIIKRALAEKNFKMYYQPIYSIKEKKFVSAEALIRLEDKKYGIISPGLFIPAAEENGTIHQIGDYVIDAVCDFVSKTDFKKYGLEYIELNLSGSQCIETNLVEKIENKISKYGISTRQINLEITESADEDKPEILEYNIKALHNKGYHFSLDDYGTGYSNLRRLTKLPLDIVKMDKSFVDEMDNPEIWSVIVNTVKMFKEMNKVILVEGVEDQKALAAFTELGCDYIQGYFFSKPLPEKEFIDFLVKHN